MSGPPDPPPPPPPPKSAQRSRSGGWLAPEHRAAESRREPVRWGFGDALLGLLVAQAAAIVGGAMILVALGYQEPGAVDDAPLSVLFLLQIPLWLGYGLVPLWASRSKGRGVVEDFGWRFRWRDAPYGVGIGILTQIVVVPLVYVPIFLLFGEQDVSGPARDLTERAADPLDVVVLALVVVVGAPLIEELFFRGLLLRSIEARIGSRWAIFASALVFGAVHFQLIQLPALVAFGLVAAWLTVRSGRLGPAIWAHVGFNSVTVISLLWLD